MTFIKDSQACRQTSRIFRVAFILIDSIRATVSIYFHYGHNLAKAYAMANLPTIGGLVYSAVSLLQQHKDPMFIPSLKLSRVFSSTAASRHVCSATQTL